jgi:NitT/TauT family transport system substrate-binding protein
MSKRRLLPLAVAGALLTTAGCGDSGETSAAGTDGGAGSTEVSLLLGFVHDMINAPLYLAIDNGWAEQCGLSLDLKTAEGVDNPLQLLVGGGVDYAIVDPLAYLAGLEQGLPIMAIGEMEARTGVAYASLAETGISGPEDLPGKTVGIQPGGDSAWYLDRIMAQTLSPEERDQVDVVPLGFAIQPLIAGSVDAYSLWPTNSDINTFIEEGQEFDLIRAFDYGIEAPGNVIVTTSDRIEDEADEVSHFLATFMAGMEASLDDANMATAVDGASSRIETDVPRGVMERIYGELQELRSTPAWEEHGVGWNDERSYQSAQDIMLEQGELEEQIPADEMFTNVPLEGLMDGGRLRDLDEVC